MPATDLSSAQWFKSSYSGTDVNCVEVTAGVHGVVPVRDSKDIDGPVIAVPKRSWSAFVDGMKAR